MAVRDDEDWHYRLPAFLDRVRDAGAHGVVENLEVDVGGVLYHHRGARVPAHNATFLRRPDGDAFEVELDAVGQRAAWARFDAAREWDFFLSKAPGDNPCLAWMCDGEFRAEEADAFESKETAVGMGRFSFGLYLLAADDWTGLEARARGTDAPYFLHRPDGRMRTPEDGAAGRTSDVPPELRGGEAPDHLGLADVRVEYG